MPAAPKSLRIRSYNVGFGDCFLLTFTYSAKVRRHVLIDYGSTGLPKGAPKTRMMDIARDIETETAGKLDAVVATHRHKDHISGFETKKRGNGTGDVIRKLKPSRVVQPWTEDPDLETDAKAPKTLRGRVGSRTQVATLHAMNSFAEWIYDTPLTRFSKNIRPELSFLGENNIANKSAIKNLMGMASNTYVYCGSKSGLERLLPGVAINVLGPPTVEQTETIKTQRAKDPDEFWHFAANAARAVGTEKGAGLAEIFKRHIRSSGPTFPVDSRWLIAQARAQRGEQLLQIVRMLDKAMNNTSVILMFRVGKKSLLFPGDAQIENWQYALSKPEYRKLLKNVDVYKVGHHGSLNATPKSLWNLFAKRGGKPSARMLSLMSTMEGKHGSEATHTEVPRRSLVNALARDTDHFSTQMLKPTEMSHDAHVSF